MVRPVALVTGASNGIGLAFARRLATSHDLVLVARSEGRLREVAEEVERGHGAQAGVLRADLATDDGVEAVETRLTAGDRPVDLLVNNAGFGSVGAFVDQPPTGEADQVRLNALALVRLTHAALPGMIARGKGAVLNVSSVAGFQPGPYNATYAATKAFVLSFSEALHEETRGTGVKVMVLCPGFTRTGFQETANAEARAVPPFLWQSAEQVVDAALRDLDRGVAVSVPGAPNKLAAALTQVLPHAVTRKVSGVFGKRLET